MAYLHRRSFLERLGLGAGAFVLAPMVTGLVRQAQGATPRKRFIVYSFSNGWFRFYGSGLGALVPAEFVDKKFAYSADIIQGADYAKLPMYAEPFAPWRNKLLIVDGLVNQQGNGGHGCADFLTCVPNASTEGAGYGRAGGISFDQYLAGTIGRGSPFASVHLGAHTSASATTKVMPAPFLAKGRDQLVPVQLDPTDAFANLFPTGAGAAGEAAALALKNDMAARRKLFDHMKEDIRRVKGRLAAPESQKMDEYLGAVEEAQARLAAFEQSPAAKGACGTAPGAGVRGTPEGAMAAQVDVAMAALTCGMTHVLTLSFIGIGKAFSSFVPGDHSLHGIGHGDAPDSGGLHDQINVWHAKQVARLAQRLASIPEGNGSMLDNSVVMFISDNAEQHHSRGWRYPAMLLGGAGGALKADGRYIKYPARTGSNNRTGTGPTGARALGDLMSTLGHALGAPVNDWGKGGLEPVKGPLSELLA